MIIRRNFFQKLLGGLATVVFAPVALRAETTGPRRRHRAETTPTPEPEPEQSPSATESPAPNEEKARLRLWKASDAPDRAIRLRLLPYGKPDAEALSPVEIQTGSYEFSNYVDVPASPLVAEVSTDGQPSVRLPLHLAEGGRATLLVRSRGTNLSIEWIDDTPGPADGGCEFCVYNLLSASGDIQVDLGSVLTVHLTSNHSSARLTGLKKAVFPIVTNGSDGTGKNFRWNNDADFRQYRKVTLLIYPDAYGRVRPRLYPA